MVRGSSEHHRSSKSDWETTEMRVKTKRESILPLDVGRKLATLLRSALSWRCRDRRVSHKSQPDTQIARNVQWQYIDLRASFLTRISVSFPVPDLVTIDRVFWKGHGPRVRAFELSRSSSHPAPVETLKIQRNPNLVTQVARSC